MKKPNIKSFFVNHIEKLLFGVFGLVVVGALATTSWGRYPDPPEKLKLSVSNVKNSITDPKNVWPDAAEYKIVDFSDKSRQLFSPIDDSKYRMQTPLFHPLNKVDEPRREPIFEAVQSLIATQALVPLGMREPEEEPTTPTPEQQLATTTPTEERDSDFGRRGPKTGTPGVPGVPGVPGIGIGGTMGRSTPFDRHGDEEETVGRSATMGSGYSVAGTTSGIKPRGVRVIAVRGVFPLQKQLQNYIDALHVTKAQASYDFEMADFVLERQVAVPGPDPWKNAKWQPVRVESAWDVLLESIEIDREDPVPLNMKDPVITMELPYRLIGNWDKLASHPRIDHELLSKKQLAEQNLLIDTLEDVASANGITDKPVPRKRGLALYQGDAKAMAKALKGNSQMVSKIQAGLAAAVARPNTPGGAPNVPGSTRPGTGRMLDEEDDHPFAHLQGGGVGGIGYAMNQIANDSAYLLFRYLDFDVQSGYAYRYRVRLKIHNPNFEALPELLGGADPSIANGQERESPWSNISNPQVVQQTTSYFLEDVGRDPYREERLKENQANPAAIVSIFDWDTKYGSVVASDPLNPPKVLNIGSYIGDKYLEEKKEVKEKEEKKKEEKKSVAPQRNLAFSGDEEPAPGAALAREEKEKKKKEPPKRNELKILDFKEGGLVTKKHYFSTLDVLLDVEPDSEIQPDQHPDLKFPMEKVKGGGSRVHLMETAMVTTSNGELKILDPITPRSQKEVMKDRVAKERKEYSDVEPGGMNRVATVGGMGGDEPTNRPGRPNTGRKRRMFGGRNRSSDY